MMQRLSFGGLMMQRLSFGGLMMQRRMRGGERGEEIAIRDAKIKSFAFKKINNAFSSVRQQLFSSKMSKKDAGAAEAQVMLCVK